MEEALFSWLLFLNQASLNPRVGLKWRVIYHKYKFCLKIHSFFVLFFIYEDLSDFQMIDSLDFYNDCLKPMITSKYIKHFLDFLANVQPLKNFLSLETNPSVLAQFFDIFIWWRQVLSNQARKKMLQPSKWGIFQCFTEPKLFSDEIWVLAQQNGQLLPTSTENLKGFGPVVFEQQRFTICHFDLKTVYWLRHTVTKSYVDNDIDAVDLI